MKNASYLAAVRRASRPLARLFAAGALLVGIVLVGASCAGAHEPEEVGARRKALIVQAGVDVAALDILGSLDPDALSLIGVVTAAPTMLAVPYASSDGSFRVGLISADARQGDVIAIVFEQKTAGAEPASIIIHAYDASATRLADVTLTTTQWTTHDSASLHAPEQTAAELDEQRMEEGVQVHGYR